MYRYTVVGGGHLETPPRATIHKNFFLCIGTPVVTYIKGLGVGGRAARGVGMGVSGRVRGCAWMDVWVAWLRGGWGGVGGGVG